MKNILLLCLLLLPWTSVFSGNKYKVDYNLLEDALANRSVYVEQKEHRIDSIRSLLSKAASAEGKLSLYRTIYDEYYTYRFDSAMFYVDQMEILAQSVRNAYYISLSTIFRSVLLTTSGYFSESIHNLDQIDAREFSDSLLLEYYIAYEWAYRQWGEYSNDTVYAPKYRKFELAYQDSIISCLKPGSRAYYFWRGERLYRDADYLQAERCYYKAFDECQVNERIYARCAYGLAMVNARLERWNRFEYYMMLASISDQICPLKENLALQELALYIYKSDEEEAARANRYLAYSMEDAIFYGNRLRLLEISHKLPNIIESYEKQKDLYNSRQRVYMIAVVFLLFITIGLVVYVYRQMLHIRESRRKIIGINKELNEKNTQLMGTNNLHEEYVSLFMNLCAAYINKLNKFRTLVMRKVKSGQTEDLMKVLNSPRQSEAETREFFINFDNSFIKLYPDFVEQFNALLHPGKEIQLKKGEILNTELRIYALIRLGVTDSGQIANLLFYSTQTIYNYRSTVRAKALKPESFEEDVKLLCSVR